RDFHVTGVQTCALPIFSAQVYDVIAATRGALARAMPATVDEVRKTAVLVCFSPEMAGESQALKRFLFDNLYRHPQVVDTTGRARSEERRVGKEWRARGG